MADSERDYLPVFGYDYDLVRWSDGKRDASGNLSWSESLPTNRDWSRIQIVTLDFGNDVIRNVRISPDRPLDVYSGRKRPGEDYFYDLDDLAYHLMVNYGLWGEE